MKLELTNGRRAFDPDVRHIVQVRVIHGYWKNDDPRRIKLEVRNIVNLVHSTCMLTRSQRNKLEIIQISNLFPRTCPKRLAPTIQR